jgi:alpha-L-fucosidase
MFEQDLPGENTAGFNKAAVYDLPLETCRTINDHWGYDKNDRNHKSTEHLIRYLVQTVGRGANLLLNTGPMPNGRILPAHVERYLGIGKWLEKNGEAIYGTRKGPYEPLPWGVSVWKGQNVYLHILEWPGETLELPAFGCEVKSARLLGGRQLKFTADEKAIKVTLPESVRNPVDVIVVLTVEGDLRKAAVSGNAR